MIRRQAIVRLLTEITALVLTWGGGSLSHGTPCQGTWLPIDGPDFSNSHSIEVYYPPYWHRATRPAIDVTSLPLSQSYSYSFALSFKVQVNPSATVDRIALLRNGANTHAFDMDQRYVELQQTAPPPFEAMPGSGVWTVSVLMPQDGFSAPPGHYMLTVTDTDQLPSPAVWIQLN